MDSALYQGAFRIFCVSKNRTGVFSGTVENT